MKTLNIIVSFCLFGLLNYDRIFGKNLERDAYGVKRNPWLRTLWGEGGGGLFRTCSLKFMLVLMKHSFWNSIKVA